MVSLARFERAVSGPPDRRFRQAKLQADVEPPPGHDPGAPAYKAGALLDELAATDCTETLSEVEVAK